jgi:SagB-type dehydrogenase family enzyme
MLSVHDTRSLPLLFHLNSEPWLNPDAYASEGYEVHYKQMGEIDEAVRLPPREAGGLDTLIAQRVSCRCYAAKFLPLATLGEMLAGAYGPTRIVRLPTGAEMDSRAVPSAGGLYPLELYVLCRRVDGLADGIYHYNILEHALEPLRGDVSHEEASTFLIAEPFVENANAIVFIAAVFDRTLHKYGPRGYRYVLLESGHVAQNLCLLATERALGSLCIGGFMDGKTNAFLGLDGIDEAVVYSFAFGHPAEADTPGE